jgi:hypothetical protein
MKLTKDELSKVQSMLGDFNQLKMKLGDAELSKIGIVKQIELIKEEYAVVEKDLAVKYGNDAQIDVKTGEITEK